MKAVGGGAAWLLEAAALANLRSRAIEVNFVTLCLLIIFLAPTGTLADMMRLYANLVYKDPSQPYFEIFPQSSSQGHNSLDKPVRLTIRALRVLLLSDLPNSRKAKQILDSNAVHNSCSKSLQNYQRNSTTFLEMLPHP